MESSIADAMAAGYPEFTGNLCVDLRRIQFPCAKDPGVPYDTQNIISRFGCIRNVTTSNPTEIQDDDGREDSRKLSLEGSEPPAEIEGFSVVRRLGTGAYGTVWLAREDRTGRMVAIKYYPHRRGLNWSLLNREVEKLATLHGSRNIVRLLDVGWNAEPPYYVMEYVENGSLGDYLAGGGLAVRESVRIARQVCGALIEAHGAGVLHCDLKPDNVLLDSQSQVRLCDFGQSRMSHELSPALGTLYYMAPEQADLEAVPDARWDVYAVGALLFHMLTGEPPYRGPDVQKQLEQADSLDERLRVYQQHIRESPLPTEHHSVRGVDRTLAGIIDQCLQPSPQDRLPNAQAILTLLNTRARNRSRRPLLLLGVVGPVLLMCAMVPIFLSAMQQNIDAGEAQIVEGIQDANTHVAISQANALHGELLSRLEELQQVVGQAGNASGQTDRQIVDMLVELMGRPTDDVVTEAQTAERMPMEQRPGWMQRLDTAHAFANSRSLAAGKSPDTSWFLTDASGCALWRRPFGATVGQYFNYRDYFHGRNVEYATDSVPPDVQPIREPHISVPFISTATNRYMVALSVPVRNRADEVIGVFARTLHLDALQKQLGQDLRGDVESSHLIALADRRERYQLLDHEWQSQNAEEFADVEEARKIFQDLHLSESTVALIEQNLSAPHAADEARGGLSVRIPRYEDPVGRLPLESARPYAVDWIAAIAPMKSEKTPWLVIVQEKRNLVVAPVSEMKQRMKNQAINAVLASFMTMGAIWLFVWYALVRSTDGDAA